MSKNSEHMRALYETYKRAVARITVETDGGDLSTGTGFHIGDGWLVTASHVLKDKKLIEIVAEKGLTVDRKILHPDDKIDLALLHTDLDLSHYMEKTTIEGAPNGFEKRDHFPIGGHLNDWIGDELVLSEVLIMGYPPVPLSRNAVLVPQRGEVNAVVDKYVGPHPHFVVSTMSRGGFSGAPVLSEYGFLLGVVTETLIKSEQPVELGFSSAISVEPLLVLLKENGIYPGSNRETIEGLPEGAKHRDNDSD